MLDNQGKYPIIIIGMHRSGTSMVTRLLEQLGLFVGCKKDPNNEAIFFLKLNGWLLGQCGGAWYNPEPLDELLKEHKNRKMVIDYLQFTMETPRIISFLGLNGYLRYRTIPRLTKPWGWKAPCNTFTLPVWLELFPDAKVIWVYRHGVDVANSLRIRTQKSVKFAAKRFQRLKPLHYFVAKRKGFSRAICCQKLDGGFSLWQRYMRRADQHIRALGEKAQVVKYEDFLANPYESLKSLLEFCGLKVSDEAISGVTKIVNISRAYAFQRDPELHAFANSKAKQLEIYGY